MVHISMSALQHFSVSVRPSGCLADGPTADGPDSVPARRRGRAPGDAEEGVAAHELAHLQGLKDETACDRWAHEFTTPADEEYPWFRAARIRDERQGLSEKLAREKYAAQR